MSRYLRKSFQSTLPAWGATGGPGKGPAEHGDFNPRSPRGERPRSIFQVADAKWISIHAPRVGSDPNAGCGSIGRSDFNPRSPRGERLRGKEVNNEQAKISIHAPRVGSDDRELWVDTGVSDFNPRSPRGERPAPEWHRGPGAIFQSTLPAWGATIYTTDTLKYICISIHAPRVGSDCEHC